jgi:polynucleotide 5'-hydroxyl-kinase GRC3/NOL9
VERISEHPSWRAALAALQTARSILLLGASDTGKTTFLTWLANALHAQGRRVAIVDADVGQSSLGPPTTVGVGLVTQPLYSAQEATPCGLYFVGSTSPRGHLLPLVIGTKRMLDRARALHTDVAIVDTCGFVAGAGGRAFKHAQIGLTDPDALVCLQHADECEGILAGYRCRQRPQVLRLQASPAARRRSLEERRAYRERALQRYFAKPTAVTVSWEAVDLLDTPLWCGSPLTDGERHRLCGAALPPPLWLERDGSDLLIVAEGRLAPSAVADLERLAGVRVRAWSVAELEGTLLGLLDGRGEVIGLGIVQRIDFAHRRLHLLASADGKEIAGIQWSRTRVRLVHEPPSQRVWVRWL